MARTGRGGGHPGPGASGLGIPPQSGPRGLRYDRVRGPRRATRIRAVVALVATATVTLLAGAHAGAVEPSAPSSSTTPTSTSGPTTPPSSSPTTSPATTTA